jgi:hypothetical protein
LARGKEIVFELSFGVEFVLKPERIVNANMLPVFLMHQSFLEGLLLCAEAPF